MKLNVGCGYKYLKGYLNIDVDRNSLADRRMEAHNLQVESQTIEEINASQLIEHLGFFKGKYFLSECFRVLKPNGILTLETPDIEKSFETFLAGDVTARESVLTWIYGSEPENMRHRYCFPYELLLDVSNEIGFTLLMEEKYYYEEHRPSLRLILGKPDYSPEYQFFSEFRKHLVSKDIPAFEDEIIIAGQETLLKKLRNPDCRDYTRILYLAVESAEVVREYFELKKQSDKDAAGYYNIAKYLSDNNFQGFLLETLKNCEAGAGRQVDAFNHTAGEGVSIINKLLKGENIEIGTSDNAIKVFSESALKSLASQIFWRGLKEFHLLNYDKALMNFKESSRIYRDNPTTYDNITKTEKIMEKDKAILH